jgi:hypothetical protein
MLGVPSFPVGGNRPPALAAGSGYHGGKATPRPLWPGPPTRACVFQCSFLRLRRGDPIAQIVFHRLDEPTVSPYRGKYQDQAQGPQKAREEPSHRPVVRPEIIWPDMQFTYRPFDDYGGGRDFKPDGGVGW